MDINQANQMLTWLDEEHRRDRSVLTELRQRVESQGVEIGDQAKRIQDLEARLASTQAKLTRFNTLEQSIQQLKDELVAMIREQEEDLTRYQRDQAKARQLEQENVSRAINELKRPLEAIPPLQERLAILKAEDQRLGEAVLSLQTRVTTHERYTAQLPDRITYVEGYRGQDLKVVSQLQEEVAELMRRTESVASRAVLLDDITRKTEQKVSAIASFRDDLVKRQAVLVEDVRLKEAQRDRQLQDWKVEIARFEEEMGKQRKLLERFSRQQDEAQQYLIGIEDYREALERDQKQMAELQRMAEDRQRRELAEWIASNEQRLTKSKLERESRWNQQNMRHEEMTQRMKQLEGWRAEDIERVQKLAKELPVMQEEYRAKLRELWVIHERAAVFQLDQIRRWYDQISTVVSEKVGDE